MNAKTFAEQPDPLLYPKASQNQVFLFHFSSKCATLRIINRIQIPIAYHLLIIPMVGANEQQIAAHY